MKSKFNSETTISFTKFSMAPKCHTSISIKLISKTFLFTRGLCELAIKNNLIHIERILNGTHPAINYRCFHPL